jgi:hypothetical protein
MKLGLWLFAFSLIFTPALRADSEAYFPARQAQALDQAGGGARAMALGSAFVAVADDSSAMQWNPAGLASARRTEIGLHHNSWLVGINQESSDLAVPMGTWGGLGLSENFIDYGSVDGRDESGNLTQPVRAQRAGLSLGWGGTLNEALDLGMSLKAGRQILASASYDSLSGAIGAIYRPLPGFQIGASFNNIGDSGSGSPLASGFLLGGSFHAASGPWQALVAAAVTAEPQGTQRAQLGAEGGYQNLLLRAGYLLSFQDNSWGGLNSMTLGCGFSLGRLRLDYAWLPFGELGVSNRISLSYAFSEASAQAQAEPAPTAVVPQAQAPSLPGPPGPSQVTVTASGPLHFEVLSEGYLLGQNLEQQGRLREALTSYHLAVSGDNQDAASWRAMARLYLKLGRKDYARDCYLRVIKIAGRDDEAEQWLKSEENLR